jgi:hypothetical protein
MDFAGSTVVLQGVGEMEAGSELFKEPDDGKKLRVVCQWSGLKYVYSMVKLDCFVEKNRMDRGGLNVIGEHIR